MTKFLWRALLALVLGITVVPFSVSAAQAASSTIHVRAVGPTGTPLDNVRWNVFAKDPTSGTWDHGLQMGPLLTDADGWMTWSNATVGTSYKICLYDDDYFYNTRSQRYADRCWVNATSVNTATVWTPTADQPNLDATVTLPAAGSSLTVGHPWVDGTAKLGQALTVRPGVWGPSGVALGYQWVTYDEVGNRTAIAGATGTTFTPTAAQDGKSLSVEVTGTLAGYRTATASAYVGKVGATTPTMTGQLGISGTPMPGNTLTAVLGTITPAGTDAVLEWYVNGKKVGTTSDVNSSHLDITPAMAGATVELDMTAYNWDCCTGQFYASAQTTIGGGVTGAKPTVSGSAVVGSTLTANAGSWAPGGVSLTYQWLREGTSIGGATSPSYVLTDADRGKKLTVNVTGTLAGGYPPVTKSSDPTAAVQGVLTSATPTISGTATVGSTLTVQDGTWGPSGVTLARQWYAGGSAISGATGSTFVPTSAEIGKPITVQVSGSLSGYVPASKTSDATAAVQGVLTSATPTITGDPAVGSTLTLHEGTWGPSGVTLARQWYAGGSAISGATGSTFVPTSAEIGKPITVQVSGSLSGYVPASKTSAATAAVQGVLTSATPTITGDPMVGSTLTLHEGTWGPTGVTLSYQWLRDGAPISGATAATYALTADDRGKTITVSVTGSLSGYRATTKTSAPTSTVLDVFTATPAPRISGTPTVGKSLTVVPGTWSPTPAFAYQWFRSGTAIAGATGSTYRLVAADTGARITVRVTASKTGYVGASATSAPTAAVTGIFAKAPTPRITGTAMVGKKLTALLGTWSPKPTIKYQWLRNGKAIKGATKATYKLTKSDRRKRITLRVTGQRPGYLTVVKTSAARKIG